MTAMLLSSIFYALLATASGQDTVTPTTVRLQRKTLQLSESGRMKNFYSAKIYLGHPAQEFNVAFDLGGGTTIVPSAKCRSMACLKRHRYDTSASESAEDINSDGRLVDPERKKVSGSVKRQTGSLDALSADLGRGVVKGSFVRDRLCLDTEGSSESSVWFDSELEGKSRCFTLEFLLAWSMTDVPFGTEPYDGTVGLGLEGMSLGPGFNFLRALTRGQHPTFPNRFRLHLDGGRDGGEITFGGFDVKQLGQPLEWVKVAEPENGRWQVAITAIRVGNNTLQACRGRECIAALDYGASLLSAPSGLASGMEQALEALAVPSGYGNGCQTTVMPDIQLVLKNDVTLTLPAEDYVSQVSPSGYSGIMDGPARSCRPHLARHDFTDLKGEPSNTQDLFVLGESVLRRYYTFFDGDALKIGFSLAAGSKKSLPPVLEAGKGKEWLRTTDEEEDGNKGIILLVQVNLRRSKTVSSLGM